MTRICVFGQGLEVEVSGSGPALLLLHGFTGTAGSWRSLADACQGQRRVIAPDLLGHGRSDAPVDSARYALERQADDLAGLLSLLDASPADVLGYSMGARLALELAIDHPGFVRSLALESASAGLRDADARAARRASDEQLAELLERKGLAAFVDGWQAQPVLTSHANLPPSVQGRLRAERLSHHPSGLAACLRGAGQGAMTPLHDRIAAIRCPTLVVAGALDTVGLGRAREVAAGIPGARLEVVAGAGHTPHLEQPKAFDHLLTSFLGVAQAIASN